MSVIFSIVFKTLVYTLCLFETSFKFLNISKCHHSTMIVFIACVFFDNPFGYIELRCITELGTYLRRAHFCLTQSVLSRKQLTG